MNKFCMLEIDFKVKLGESIICFGVYFFGLDFDFIIVLYFVSFL